MDNSFWKHLLNLSSNFIPVFVPPIKINGMLSGYVNLGLCYIPAFAHF